MLYLLDANTLIDAKRDYFQFSRVPEFWSWIQYQGEIGSVKIPIEVYEEFEEAKRPDGSRDELAEWASRTEVKDALLLSEEAAPELVQIVMDRGYCADPTDEEVHKIGRDPFLVAYALVDPEGRRIVTTEVSRPNRQRANRKIPDVCRNLGIEPLNNFELLGALDFTTGWQRQ